MARSQPIQIGARRFASKKDALAVCSAILNSPSIDDAGQAFLLDLIDIHPESEIKVGCGVLRFFVAADGFGGRCLWLERIDGSKTDFSFRACVSAPSHESEVRRAFRFAIKEQARTFRDLAFAAGPVRCAITNAPLLRDACHVDHRPPQTFLLLLTLFLGAEGLTTDAVQVNPTADGDTETRLIDEALANRWRAFHASRAVLQVTSARANLSQGSGR